MPSPLRPELWDITLPAIRAALEAGSAYIESSSYVPRDKVPSYEINEHGWSTTTAPFLSFSNSGPPDWHQLFALKPGKFAHLIVDDVPALKQSIDSFLSMARQDETLRLGISIFAHSDDDQEQREEYLRRDYLIFVIEAVSRSYATNANGDAEIFDIYLQLERARFAVELSGDLLVPIALTAFDLPDVLEIAPGIYMEPLTEDIQRARSVSMYSERGVSSLVVAAATHAIVIKDVTLDNRNWVARRYRDQIHNLTDLARVDRVMECLYLLIGRDTGYTQVVLRPDGWADSWTYDLPAIWRIATLHRYPARFDEGGWREPQNPVSRDQLEGLGSLYASLAASPENVKLSSRRLFRSVLRTDDEDQTIDCSIGIEALLLSNSDRDELTHRMAQRAAAALAPHYSPRMVFRMVKDIYAHRSAIVHGRTRTKATTKVNGSEYATKDLAKMLLRILLLSYLREEDPWSPGLLDAKLLDSLAPLGEDSAG